VTSEKNITIWLEWVWIIVVKVVDVYLRSICGGFNIYMFVCFHSLGLNMFITDENTISLSTIVKM